MLQIRLANQRGHAELDWLSSWHTFSFDTYYDPQYTHFRELRVINQDFVAPGRGFDSHPHRDMEIITYVIQGSLTHKDSMGNEAIIRAGDIQIMSAGTGVTHSEQNGSSTEPVELLQMWVFPNKKHLTPRYEQKKIPQIDRTLQLLVSNEPDQDSVKIHQDIKLYKVTLMKKEDFHFSLDAKRFAWLQIIKGSVKVNTLTLKAGDGASVTDETDLHFQAADQCELLLFDLG